MTDGAHSRTAFWEEVGRRRFFSSLCSRALLWWAIGNYNSKMEAPRMAGRGTLAALRTGYLSTTMRKPEKKIYSDRKGMRGGRCH